MSNYYQSHADKIIKSTLTALELAGCNYNQGKVFDNKIVKSLKNLLFSIQIYAVMPNKCNSSRTTSKSYARASKD